jgi:6-phosphofructokinase 1
MGRDCGYLALMTAIAGGAEAVVLPESEIDPELLAAELAAAYDRGKSHAIVVVAEGSHNNTSRLLQHFQEHHERIGFKLRATILGHIQRGGNPNVFDRVLATELGAAAVRALLSDQHGVLVRRVGGKITTTPLDVVVTSKKPLDPSLLELAHVMTQ